MDICRSPPGSSDIKGRNRKNAFRSFLKRDLAAETEEENEISTARACRIVSMDRSMVYYESIKDDTELEERLKYYAQKLPSRDCPEYTKRMRKEGYNWNHKRVGQVQNKVLRPWSGERNFTI